jgi:hypothetical protein
VHTDPQSSFRTLTTNFENVVIDTSGAGDFVPKVDVKIRSIKEVPCIALYLCCNATGSWNFYNLVSRKRIRRMIWKKMVMTGLFVEKNERSS